MINFRKIWGNNNAKREDLKKLVLRYANQENFYKDEKATKQGMEISKKDTFLFIAGWNELNKSQKMQRTGCILIALLSIAFLSAFLPYLKDSKMMTGICSVIIAIPIVLLLTCIISHLTTAEDRKMAEEINLSTTATRKLVNILEALEEVTFKDFISTKIDYTIIEQPGKNIEKEQTIK